ncbi:hypothetical protein [Halothiobacillus sp. DCM-1]|uniref:hypothetical protein n=1 Tax=Halothiobacillus sp. DCM-1 TaxID=3112558 RepID=UPI00324BAAD4
MVSSPFVSLIAAWQQADFIPRAQAAVASLGLRGLPLQKAISFGNVALDDALSVQILAAEQRPEGYFLRAGVQYTSMITGCHCADDPSPEMVVPEYCTVELLIDPVTALPTVRLVD